jgi:aspartate--ammonia ligase
MATTELLDKRADLAGPGIGSYEDLEKILPEEYVSALLPKDTQRAITAVKRHIEDGLCRELNLIRVEAP